MNGQPFIVLFFSLRRCYNTCSVAGVRQSRLIAGGSAGQGWKAVRFTGIVGLEKSCKHVAKIMKAEVERMTTK